MVEVVVVALPPPPWSTRLWVLVPALVLALGRRRRRMALWSCPRPRWLAA